MHYYSDFRVHGSKFIGFGVMEATKPYEFIGFGAMEVTKPYEFIGFGAMEVTKPYSDFRVHGSEILHSNSIEWPA
jgi:hypothetical protein